MSAYSSTPSQFIVTLPNLNYETKTGVSPEKQDFKAEKQDFKAEKQVFNHEKSGVSSQNLVFEELKCTDSISEIIDALPLNAQSKKNLRILFEKFRTERLFSGKDIRDLCNLTDSPAGNLITKMKNPGLIENINGNGKGKYKFIHSDPK